MPVVDVHDIPTVVEFASEHKVVEFTEESVTAEVVVGPTVVEFSWGELVPEPGLSGGGPFEGRVFIRPDIPTLPTNSEPIDPEADYLMLYDASSETHVKVLAQLGGGGSGDGGTYEGSNLGTGAAVYKETDQAATPNRLHKFRSLVAGSNITIAEDPDSIIISSLAGGSGGGSSGFGRPETDFIGSFGQRCGLRTTSFNVATDLPNAKVGDFVAWIVYFSYTAGTTSMPSGEARVFVPTGWTPFIQDVYTGHRVPYVFYKYLTASDLSATFTAYSNAAPLRTMCSYGFAFRNVHPTRPFGTPASSSQAQKDVNFVCAPWPLLYGNQHILQIWSIRGDTPTYGPVTAWPLTNQLGPTDFVAREHGGILDETMSDTFSCWADTWVWEASIDQDENWIGYETDTSTMVLGEWTYNNVTFTPTPGVAQGQAEASGVLNARHYFEKEVTLVAGEKYSFYVYIHTGNDLEDVGGCLSVVDPSNNEFAYSADTTTSAVQNLNAIWRNDPLGTHNVNWFGYRMQPEGNGVPAPAGSWLMIYFTATEAGVHKLRFNCISATPTSLASLTFTPSTDELEAPYISHACFRRGWHSPQKILTPYGPVMAGERYSDYNRKASTIGWLVPATPDSGTAGSSRFQSVAIPLNPNWEKFPRARLSDSYIVSAIGTNCGSGDGLAIDTYAVGNNGFYAPLASDLLMYPTHEGQYQKYYFEVTMRQSSSGAFGLGLARPVDYASAASFNTAYDYRPDPVAVNDVFGVQVDFVNGVVTYYKNNVLAQTINMPAKTWPTTGISFGRDWPLALVVTGRASGNHYDGKDFTVNFTGPFVYPRSSDYKPADYFSAADVQAGSGVVSIAGPGIPVGYSGPNHEVVLKTVTGGLGIEITDSGTNLDIAVDGNELGMAMPPRIRGATWSSGSAIIAIDAQPVSVICPAAGVITGWTVIGDAVGNCTISVRKTTLAGLPAGAGAAIDGSSPPGLSAERTASNNTLSGWTTNVAPNDVLTFVLTGCSGLKNISVQLTIKETF